MRPERRVASANGTYILIVKRQGPRSTDTTLYVPAPYRVHEIARTSMTVSLASLGGAGTIAYDCRYSTSRMPPPVPPIIQKRYGAGPSGVTASSRCGEG